jgi:DtxR family transcriptional regulator, Mn-dependent transcriptional regulator
MPDPLTALVLALAIILLLVLVFWPTFGLLSLWKRHRQMSTRVLTEDALKHLYQAEVEDRDASLQSIAGTLEISSERTTRLLEEMQQRGLVVWKEDRPRLTSIGRHYALHMIRAHRLAKVELADRTGYDQSEWHALAECREHELTTDDIDALSAKLGHPTHDPDGNPIPPADGLLRSHGGEPLTTLKIDQTGRIVHIADEPPTIVAQLVAEELSPGMTVRILDKNDQRIVFWADGDEHILAPMLAGNISVVPLSDQERSEMVRSERLCDLNPGERARIVQISRFCHGAERRRLLDLGLTPGTVVEAELESASGDTKAYRIRGALIALRSEQARMIHVTRLNAADTA